MVQTAFVFEVLEGPNAQQVIELAGRMLPHRATHGGALSYGVEQRIKTTWYPGSREGSQQVLGPTLKPTDINGAWDERYLGAGVPKALAALFTELCQQGARVRVSWQEKSLEGVIKSFVETPGITTGGRDNIGWTMTLEWSRDADRPSSRAFRSLSSVTTRDQCAEMADDLADTTDAIFDYAAQAEYFVGLPRTAFAGAAVDLRAGAEVCGQTAEDAAQAHDRMVLEGRLSRATAQGLLASLGAAQDALWDRGNLLAALIPGLATEDDSLPAVLAEENARRDVGERCLLTARRQYDLALVLQAQVAPPPVAVITAVSGSDLRALSNRYYGNPDQWRRIGAANGIVGSTVPEDLGELVIPLDLPDALELE